MMPKCSERTRIDNLIESNTATAVSLAKVETQNEAQMITLGEIKKALMGNGNPGLIDDMAQMKGGISAFKWVSGTIIGLMAVCVTAMATGII